MSTNRWSQRVLAAGSLLISVLLVAVSSCPIRADPQDDAPTSAYVLTQTEDALPRQADEASLQAPDTLIDQLQLAAEVSVRLYSDHYFLVYETDEGALSSNQQIFFSSYMGLDGDGFVEVIGGPLHWNGRTFSMSFEKRYPDSSDSFVWRIEGTVSADAQTLESLTLFREMHYCNLMPRVLPRINHDGYKNATTSDSWTEGFAEFFSLLVNREIAVDGTLPQLYHWAGTVSNLEANWISWSFHNSQSFEEFAVASLLWDLLDPVDAKDETILTHGTGAAQVKTSYADRVEVPLATLWSYLSHNRGGDYGYNLHIKHLYDVLAANGVGATVGANGLTVLDELFIAHGFFSDTGAHRGFYDAGETIGATGYLTYTVGGVEIPTRPQRPSPPTVPDAYVKMGVVDGSGAPVAVTRFDVDVRFNAPFEIYNFTFEATATDDRLFFLPAPPHYPGTISVTPQGMPVDAPLVLTNEFVWTAPADANGVILSHTFETENSAPRNLYLPTVTNTKAAPAPTFSDDFCNPNSGWPQTDQSVYSLHYIAGPPCQYQIRINVDNRMAAATPGKSATDFSLESLVRLDSAHAGGAGLLFGLNYDWSRFYVMGIGTNGKFWLARFEGDAWADVIPPTVSSLISQSAENHLKVESQGSRFTVYINGSQVGQVEESGSHSGRVGLYAEGVAAFDARFRNYILWDLAATSAGQRDVTSGTPASVHQPASARFED